MGSLSCSTPASYNMSMSGPRSNGTKSSGGGQEKQQKKCCTMFQMPLHYPRYKKTDYETMPEWKLDCLLTEYGLPVYGDVAQKRKFAMGAFLWQSD